MSVDTGCRLNGWCGDSALTYPAGRIAPAVQRLLDVTKGTLNLAFELMHTKSRWSQIAREMADYVRDNGFSTVECFVGHGIGRRDARRAAGAEFPQPRPAGQRRFPHRAGPGDCRRADGEHGHQTRENAQRSLDAITLDRKPSAHFEHTIAMTNDGPWLLTAAPTPEEIANLPWEVAASESTKTVASRG